ncbi:hypothetical protein ABIC28_001634 [Rhodococcus sp. PvR044]|uniref:SHOCT domain-containing protein n=1 Tax=Rhodococcus sp. PvR044 TaxID=3156402 RepID=UPI0033960CA1
MAPQLSPRLKDKTAEKWMAGLIKHLFPGETVWALARTNQIKPTLEGLAITNARVLAFVASDLTTKGPKVGVDADNLGRYEFVKKFTGAQLVVTTNTQQSLSLGVVDKTEIDFVRHYIDHLTASGFPADVREAVQAHEADVAAQKAAAADADAAQKAAAAAAEQARRGRRGEVDTVGGNLKEKGWQTIADHSAPEELPWFILNGESAGFLAAFEDRLIIAKVGGMAGFMSGSLGGGRVTTFPYTDITNIEFNSGMLTGVLEVLTPSYQGTGNHDYWRSSNKARNKASDDPWTLSNCLPLAKAVHKTALPRINEMQRKIADAKRPQIVVQHAPQVAPAAAAAAPSGGLAEELQQLADLHGQGMLDTEEFAAAKRAAIAKHTNH